MPEINDVHEQKTVVISGATRGIGWALSAEFLRHGWFVYGCGTNAEAVAELGQHFGPSAQFSVVDVTDAAQVESWAARLPAPPALVIANAGVIHAPAPAWAISEQEMRRNLDVNVLGVFHLARSFVPRLLPHGGTFNSGTFNGGTFIGLSSSWGREAANGMAAYCASKFAVEGFLKSLALDALTLDALPLDAQALDTPSGLRVYPLDPGGGIDTDMLRTCLPGDAGVYPTAEVWARRAYRFLVNELPQFPSGTSVTVPDVHS